MFDGIVIDSPSNLTNYINRKTLTSDDAKGLRNAFTNARITLSNVLPLRNTKDRDYPLWPFIKFVRHESKNLEDNKLVILREISDILLENMPNYKTNNNFKEYKYQDLIKLNEYNSLTELEKTFLDIIAKSNNDMMGRPRGIGLIYGNDRLLRFYINTLLRMYKEEKGKNANITSEDIVKLMQNISIVNICINDFINNFSEDSDNLNREEKEYIKETRKELFNKLQERYNNNMTIDGQLFNERQNKRTTRPVAPVVNVSIVDVEGTPNCPSAGKKPVLDIPYNKQVLIFHPDKNIGCQNKDEVNRKFIELKSMFIKSGGKRRKSKRRKSNKRRNTKRRYRK